MENAQEIKVEIIERDDNNQKEEGFKMHTLDRLFEQSYETTEPIIKSLLNKGQTAIIGGETGTKKSMVAMHCALSIASGVPLFEHFEIKEQKVVLIQFENENNDIQQRFKAMTKYYDEKVGNSNWHKKIYVIEVNANDEDFVDNWIRIRATLDKLGFSNGVLIVDNIYTSTNLEIQLNEEAKKLVREFNSVRKQYKLSILLIAHCNKGTYEESIGLRPNTRWSSNMF